MTLAEFDAAIAQRAEGRSYSVGLESWWHTTKSPAYREVSWNAYIVDSDYCSGATPEEVIAKFDRRNSFGRTTIEEASAALEVSP